MAESVRAGPQETRQRGGVEDRKWVATIRLLFDLD